MNEPIFRIRPYSQKELVKLYFPDTRNEDSAVANLRNLMKRNPDLLEELAAACYKPHDKVFTPRQVSIIVRYLGEP